MEVYLNQAGGLSCCSPDANTSVDDLIRAVEQFCRMNINCSDCADTCCAGFIVYADHVFLRNLERLLLQVDPNRDITGLLVRSLRLDPGNKKWFVPQGKDGKCQYLSRQGNCLIYAIRPLVCRLHVCRQAEADYQELKDNLYYAYHEALKTEMIRLLTGRDTAMPEYWITSNPLLGMNDYSAEIKKVMAWAKASRQRLELIF